MGYTTCANLAIRPVLPRIVFDDIIWNFYWRPSGVDVPEPPRYHLDPIIIRKVVEMQGGWRCGETGSRECG
jgi:hypothetical protein